MCFSTIVCNFFCVFLFTQLHWGACLVNRMLTGAQAVLQLGGGSLRRGGRTDDRVDWVYQWGGGTGRWGSRGPWGRWVGDFTPHLTAPASSSTHWTGQTRAPRSTSSKWSPAEERDIVLFFFAEYFTWLKTFIDFYLWKIYIDLETGMFMCFYYV